MAELGPAALQEDEADLMLDSSHHHGDFLSPPGGHSPDGRAVANARPTAETLTQAVDVISHEAPTNPVVNGVQQGGALHTRACLLHFRDLGRI